jgi:hypothetical protein
MAKVIYSAEINELIGSVGGTTFQRNASGAIAKLKTISRGRSSSSRQDSNIRLNEIVLTWSTLTLTQQGLWSAFAAAYPKTNYYGVEKVLSGYNWFISINSNRYLTEQALLVIPPTYATPGVIPAFDVNLGETYLELDLSSWATGTNYYTFVYATPPIRSLSLKNRNKIKLIAVGNWGPEPVIDLKTEWSAIFGVVYPPSTVPFSFNILMSVAAVDKVTGISGQFTSAISAYNP